MKEFKFNHFLGCPCIMNRYATGYTSHDLYRSLRIPISNLKSVGFLTHSITLKLLPYIPNYRRHKALPCCHIPYVFSRSSSAIDIHRTLVKDMLTKVALNLESQACAFDTAISVSDIKFRSRFF